jgi:GrpB-like predicted nucleotidyltransferase (UPF0157 family)
MTSSPAGPQDGGLGLTTSEVRLFPHDPDWVPLGARECATVRVLLGDLAIDVMHVGSTAVPGIAAKPILDIVATTGDSVTIDEVVGRLCATGTYSYEGDQGDDGGLLLVRGSGELRTVHVHVVGAGSQARAEYRRFLDILLNDWVARERYESVKRQLAQRYPHDRRAYTRAKSAVIRELLDASGPSAGARPN